MRHKILPAIVAEVDDGALLPEVRQQFYAISVEGRLRHPAVVAISQGARDTIFA